MSLSVIRRDRGKLMTPTVLDFTSHKPLTVILGAHTLQRREKSWQTFEVKEYHCHPDFTSPKKGNDILLLKVTCLEHLHGPDELSCSRGAEGDGTPTGQALISSFSVPLPS